MLLEEEEEEVLPPLVENAGVDYRSQTTKKKSKEATALWGKQSLVQGLDLSAAPVSLAPALWTPSVTSLFPSKTTLQSWLSTSGQHAVTLMGSFVRTETAKEGLQMVLSSGLTASVGLPPIASTMVVDLTASALELAQAYSQGTVPAGQLSKMAVDSLSHVFSKTAIHTVTPVLAPFVLTSRPLVMGAGQYFSTQWLQTKITPVLARWFGVDWARPKLEEALVQQEAELTRTAPPVVPTQLQPWQQNRDKLWLRALGTSLATVALSAAIQRPETLQHWWGTERTTTLLTRGAQDILRSARDQVKELFQKWTSSPQVQALQRSLETWWCYRALHRVLTHHYVETLGHLVVETGLSLTLLPWNSVQQGFGDLLTWMQRAESFVVEHGETTFNAFLEAMRQPSKPLTSSSSQEEAKVEVPLHHVLPNLAEKQVEQWIQTRLPPVTQEKKTMILPPKRDWVEVAIEEASRSLVPMSHAVKPSPLSLPPSPPSPAPSQKPSSSARPALQPLWDSEFMDIIIRMQAIQQGLTILPEAHQQITRVLRPNPGLLQDAPMRRLLCSALDASVLLPSK